MDGDLPSDIDPATALEASGEYRVLRKLGRRLQFAAAGDIPTRIGIILDTETTGLSHTSDEIIELGMLKFSFSTDGKVFDVLEQYTALREPAARIPPAVSELTGITHEMVAGQTIAIEQVEQFIADAVLIIAHGAGFDRPFCESLVPAFSSKHWACANTEVDWSSRGHRGSKLTYLLNDIGQFYEGHRALDDCFALLEVLASTSPRAAGTALDSLLQTARQATVRIWAQSAPFEHKDTLKARGYRGSEGSADSPKAWWKDLPEVNAESELAFLRQQIYGNDQILLPTRRHTSLQRFSARI